MKKNTVHKLTIRELISLDAFLRGQATDMSLTKAHGFITAVASFPEMIMPSEWIPLLVGELKLLHDQTPISLMLENLVILYKQIAQNLESEHDFEFTFSPTDPAQSIRNASYASIQEWCNGYCLALVWNERAWLNIKEEYISKACTTFFMLTDLINAAPDAHLSNEWQQDKQILIRNLPDLVKALHMYWSNKHKSSLINELHSIRFASCPCGSKKAYQSCCLLEADQASLH